MRDKYKKIKAYIFRTWEESKEPPFQSIKKIPPFIWELITYLIDLAILIGLFYLYY